MSAVCPQGHTSQATDYCDICGEPMATTAAASSAAPGTGSPSTAAPAGPTACPNCTSPAAPNALFCENCGYDFTTGTAPVAANPLVIAAVPPAPSTGVDPNSAALVIPAPGAAGALVAPGGEGEEGEEASKAVGSRAPAAPAADPGSAALPTPAIPGKDSWVAEVWIDPDWYAEQRPEDPIPSVGMPQVVALRSSSILVGRPSKSRGIAPQVDCGADTGVSRRHVQLTTDGQRWWVEDLQSANGTYLSAVGEPLPTAPLASGERRELEDGTRIFLGGWTRIVVRKALPGEV